MARVLASFPRQELYIRLRVRLPRYCCCTPRRIIAPCDLQLQWQCSVQRAARTLIGDQRLS
jgi:hypothetical protein